MQPGLRTSCNQHKPANESDELIHACASRAPRLKEADVCFMLAPPAAPLAPVASSRPPSPLGPAGQHSQSKSKQAQTFSCLDAHWLLILLTNKGPPHCICTSRQPPSWLWSHAAHLLMCRLAPKRHPSTRTAPWPQAAAGVAAPAGGEQDEAAFFLKGEACK